MEMPATGMLNEDGIHIDMDHLKKGEVKSVSASWNLNVTTLYLSSPFANTDSLLFHSMAITFADGVILGADSRTTTGAYIANRVTDKLTRVADTIWCCRSGSAADTQAVADVVSYYLGMYATMEGEQPSVGVAAGLFQEVCYSNKEQLSAGIIIAGHHPSHGGSVYSIPLGGSLHRQSYAIGGSGSTYIYGYCDSYWKENMPEADGINFVRGALKEAIKWDGSSGGVIRMVVLTEKGAKRLLFLPDQGYEGPGEIAAGPLPNLICDLVVAISLFEHVAELVTGRSKSSRHATPYLKIHCRVFGENTEGGNVASGKQCERSLYRFARYWPKPRDGIYWRQRSLRLQDLRAGKLKAPAAALAKRPTMKDPSLTTMVRLETDTSHFHPIMPVGDKLQTSSRRSESTRNLAGLAQASRLPNSVSSQARIPSSSTTPTQSTFPSNRPRSASHTSHSATSTGAPPSRGHTRQPPSSSTLQETPQQVKEEEAPYGYDQNGFPLSSNPEGLTATPPSPRLQPTHRSYLSFSGSGCSSPNRIKVRDLNHIQSFASEEVLTRSHHGSRHSLRGKQEIGQQYEISAMPVTDIIEMVAGLLTKITTTNDRQHEYLHKHIPPPEGTTGLSQQSTSVLAFHGKNVPSITILSYLSRIHKYCPTTYEVFLSLLVYFDRMTEMVNSDSLRSFRDHEALSMPNSPTANRSSPSASHSSAAARSPASTVSSATSSEMADVTTRSSPDDRPAPHPPPTSEEEEYNLSHFFVVDSFNIHRLVIAGVTCASKFFSDVFYTNSRYAKVGGLPLGELNHLELQFLLLNEFRLSVPVEELEAYGTMLVEFYAREVMAQQQGTVVADGLYMQEPTRP
ncbi:MAG: hypothetical protein LQ338_001393 [Usnochroma carphineum]|nr:MAG: hypothetical protein LQ338_001393 [Usnochroma carphineum]